MSDFPSQVLVSPQHTVIDTSASLYPDIYTTSPSLTTYEQNTGAWPAASAAYFIPVVIGQMYTAAKMFVFNGGTVSGNIDVGIYDWQGNRMVSIGTTVQTGTAGIQSFDITDTTLQPGLYYLAVCLDNTSGIINHWINTAIACRYMGILMMTGAFPLPATATFAAMTQAFIPTVGVTMQTVI